MAFYSGECHKSTLFSLPHRPDWVRGLLKSVPRAVYCGRLRWRGLQIICYWSLYAWRLLRSSSILFYSFVNSSLDSGSWLLSALLVVLGVPEASVGAGIVCGDLHMDIATSTYAMCVVR